MIVADVNLVAYLLFGGPELPLARQVFRRDSTWCAPALWRSEFRSILAAYLRERRPRMDILDAWRAHELAERLFAGREYTVSGEPVLRLVADSPCSAYDCEYVALAAELGVPLVTWDRQVQKAFPKLALSPAAFLAAT